MKARAFDYRRVDTLEAAFAAFAACPGKARFLAGGQGLLPALNQRLDAPDLLIDIGRIEALRGIARSGERLRIGALTRHAETMRSTLVADHAPLLTQAAAFMAHPAIRNLGTMGGSIAIADPASELPACMVALDARIEIANEAGRREVGADAYFRTRRETDLRPGELITAILIPAAPAGTRMRFDELARRRGDYAMVGLAANAAFEDGRIAAIRLGFCSVGPTPMRARHAEAALAGGAPDPERIGAAQDALGRDLRPDEDEALSAAARMHLARVLLGRVLTGLARGSA